MSSEFSVEGFPLRASRLALHLIVMLGSDVITHRVLLSELSIGPEH